MVFQLLNKDKKEQKRVYFQHDVTARYVLLSQLILISWVLMCL